MMNSRLDMLAEQPSRKASSAAVLAIEVTSRCDRSCIYCYRPGIAPDRGQDLPAAELIELAEKALAATGRRIVQLSGGEPMLRPDLFEIVEKLSAPGRRISLVTDAALIDDRAAARLKALGVGPVQPTLLAARRDVHDRMKGGPSFYATLAAIGRMLKAGVPVTVSFVCTRLNWQHFRDVIELCFALGVRTVAFSRFCTAGVGAAHKDELTPDPVMVSACLDVAVKAVRSLGMKIPIAISLPMCVPDREKHAALRFGRCALSTPDPGYTIDSTGKLRACSVSPVVLGDLRTESWESILARSRPGYFADVSRVPPACAGCDLQAQCRGGCRESARAASGSLDFPDPLAKVSASVPGDRATSV